MRRSQLVGLPNKISAPRLSGQQQQHPPAAKKRKGSEYWNALQDAVQLDKDVEEADGGDTIGVDELMFETDPEYRAAVLTVHTFDQQGQAGDNAYFEDLHYKTEVLKN